jgi:Flp pilus assembly protein TadG
MQKLRDRFSTSNRERGSAVFVWIVVLFPVFFSLFGAAIDVAVAEFTRTSLQTSLDAATQSTISQATNTTTSTASPQLSQGQARINFVNYFSQNLNTSALPWLDCTGGSGSSCGFDVTDFQTKTNTVSKQVTSVTVSVHETSTPLFLNAFNILPGGWQYNLTSTATQTSTYVKVPGAR